jgi:hypothetical protein
MLKIWSGKVTGSLLRRCGSVMLCALIIGATFGPAPAAQSGQMDFASPEEAVQAMVKALKANDQKAMKSILGAGSEDIMSSGDPVADKAGRENFLRMYEQKKALERQGSDRAVLNVGNEDWPFPIPLVGKNGKWRFDTKEGREELLARRIGRNELNVIQVCLAYVDAQREYAFKDRDGDGLLEYAMKFASDPGKKDGLFWAAGQGEEQSPLGSLVATAQARGYKGAKTSDKPVPYHGYYYRILQAQGPNAQGGAYEYVVKGNMMGGFALAAYPAKYGVSGVMTFIVNHEGVVYQKDLGKKTAELAVAMKLFDPDKDWKKVQTATAQAK